MQETKELPEQRGAVSALLRELARTDDGARGLPLLHPGQVIGRFELVREIGRGGFGVVYEARDRELGRAVAFKALRTGGESWQERPPREAEAAARLSHPNIVTLFDVGRCEQGPYLVLELLRGASLAELLRRGPLPIAEALRIASEVARGIAHAHAQGVLHRDLTPGNVFVCRGGPVKVLDFGLAHTFGWRKVNGGTPAFMAPEQQRGAPEDERTDVFSLGLILQRMLAGALPDRGSPAGARPRPTRLPGPDALGALVSRMLEDDPARRPASAGAVLAELATLQDRLRAGARPRAVPAGLRVASRAALVAALVAGIALSWHLGAATRRAPAQAAAAAALPSVAVLPFRDVSPSKDEEYFSDGFSEEVLNALARLPGLRVAGRSSSFSLRGTGDLPTVGRKLSVEHVLEGTVRRSGGRVLITATLVAASAGRTLWSRSFDRAIAEVHATEDDIARAVADALQVGPLPERAAYGARHGAAHPEAYRHYLFGRHFWNMLSRGENNRRAVSSYEQALALDPSYAPALAGLALAVFAVGDEIGTPASERQGCESGLAAVEKALALDPELAEGYSSRGQLRAWCRWEWSEAEADVDRALALAPGDVSARRRKGILRLVLGQPGEAAVELRRAIDLDPLVPLTWRWLGIAEMSSGRVREARETLTRVLEIAPGDAYGTYLLANAHLLEGRPATALAALERSADQGDADRVTGLALAHHDLGQAAAERDSLAELRARFANGDNHAAGDLARYYVWVGDLDAAFAWLERGYARHATELGFLKADPILRRLRGDPRYAALLGRMKLPLDERPLR